MLGHPSCRCFSKEEFKRVKEMTESGIAPRQILSSLRQCNPNLKAVSRTVYNAKAKMRGDKLGGCTMIQALAEEPGINGFTYDVESDSTGHVTHLFFAHPISIALTKSYSHVFVMDCTYKTNNYKMPLLDIVGVSSFNTSFYSCFTFLQKEEVEDYTWALKRFRDIVGVNCEPLVIVTDRELASMKAIIVVFPTTSNILCVWHIEKNILANCTSQFQKGEDWEGFMKSWTAVINSQSEKECNRVLEYFEIQYKEKTSVLNYIKNTWLHLKAHFVCAWIEKHTRFGTRVTSMVEGAHALLKRHLQVSTGDLSEERYGEWPLARQQVEKKIYELVDGHDSFLHEPRIQPHKGRPTGSKNKKTTSIRRDSSAFEFVEKLRKCSICKDPSHNKRYYPFKDDPGTSLCTQFKF